MGIEWITSDEPGHWRQDPVSQAPIALGAKWGEVRPFVIRSAARFRAPPPPSMSSEAYTRAFDEVKALGGDGVATPTERSADQTQIGIYWAYDGTPSLCAPPGSTTSSRRPSARATTTCSRLRGSSRSSTSRWRMPESRSGSRSIYYDFWRPVTGIREADEGIGPDAARATAIPRRSAIRTSCRSARRRAT